LSSYLGFLSRICRTLKRLGLGDDRIILMLSDAHGCDPRNPFPGQMFHSDDLKLNIYGDSIEVDYRGYEVTVENFIRVLTGTLFSANLYCISLRVNYFHLGRHDEAVPQRKRLMRDDGSNILIYMTGHGGDEFIKFQDAEEISSQDIADAIQQMYLKQRYTLINSPLHITQCSFVLQFSDTMKFYSWLTRAKQQRCLQNFIRQMCWP